MQCRPGGGRFLRRGPSSLRSKEPDDLSDAQSALSKNRHKSLAYGLHIEKFASPLSASATQ